MKGTLLREYLALDYDKKVIAEAKDKKIPVIVSALLQRANIKNQNHRVYPKEILEREVINYTKSVQEGTATGELDHPESSIVSLENISHIIREIWWDGDEVKGKVEILDTPKGRIAKDLMAAGVKLGISSRGVGNTIQGDNDCEMVDESYMLIAFDLVSEPSTHEAWLSEGKKVSTDEVRQMISKNNRINRLVNKILLEENT